MASKPLKTRVLLLGASGKIGRALRQGWLRNPPENTEIISVFRPESSSDAGLVWAPGMSLPEVPRIDAILAVWGVTGGNPQALSANVQLAREAMRLGHDLGAAQVLHCSSAAVYGRAAGMLGEDPDPEPATPYGAAKLAMEKATFGTPTDAVQTILRIGNVAGADSLFANLQPGARLDLDRFPSGEGPSRSYIAPDDLGRVVLAAIEQRIEGIVNVSAPRPTSMAEIVRAAGCAVVWRDAPADALPCLHLDTSRLATFCPLPDEAADPASLVAAARASGLWP